MMTEEHIKEQLSKAFAKAIAATAGFIFREHDVDYGFDGRFSDVDYDVDCNGHKHFSENGFGIDIQIKATTNIVPKEGYLIFNLEAKNYNALVKTNIGTPRMLIVYSMPKDRSLWLTATPESVTLRKCAWWCSLKGQSPTPNSYRKCIRIPSDNLLTAEELCNLISRVKGGEEL
jgi:hypothetical protein